MSSFELEDLGDGRFAVRGEMSFETADQLLKESERVFAQHEMLDIDLSGVDKADSAGLALMLEWKARVSHGPRKIRFSGVPASILAVAQTAEVSHLIE